MRKAILILLMTIVSISIFAARTVSAPYPQVINGFINAKNYLDFELDHTVLPFNLLSETVAKPGDNVDLTALANVRGLRIGYMSFWSNQDTFTLTITHDKLKSDSASDNSELDYCLYVFYTDNVSFVSCLSGQTASITKNNFPANTEMYYADNQSMYVLMNETAETIEAAGDGTYSSTITIEISN